MLCDRSSDLHIRRQQKLRYQLQCQHHSPDSAFKEIMFVSHQILHVIFACSFLLKEIMNGLNVWTKTMPSTTPFTFSLHILPAHLPLPPKWGFFSVYCQPGMPSGIFSFFNYRYFLFKLVPVPCRVTLLRGPAACTNTEIMTLHNSLSIRYRLLKHTRSTLTDTFCSLCSLSPLPSEFTSSSVSICH